MKKSLILLLVLTTISILSALFYAKQGEESVPSVAPSGMVSPLVPLRSVLSAVETSERAVEQIDVIVEVPRGSTVKYQYDVRLSAMRYNGRLPSYVKYPGEYGTIAHTKAERGEPLRAVVLSNEETFPGVVIEARPIALFVLGTEEKEENIILAVPATSPLYALVTEITGLAAAQREEVATAFNAFTDVYLQRLPFLRTEDSDAARELILEARERYVKQ